MTNRDVGPAIPSGLTLSPIPAKTSELSLNLYLSVDQNSPQFKIPLDDFVFGTSLTAATTGDVVNETTFDPLVVSGQMQGISPSLFAALRSGRRFAKATLTQSTADAPLTITTLGNVYITDDLISGNADTLPNQQLKLLYSQITQSAAGVATSWDILQDRAIGPAPLPGPDLSSLPTSTGSIVLELKEFASDSRPRVRINLDSLEYGFDKISTVSGWTH